MRILILLLIPLIGGISVFFLSGKRRSVTVLAVSGFTALFSLLLVLRGHETLTLLRLSERLSLSFALDGLAKLFILLISVIWVFVGLYSFDYMEHEEKQSRFFGFFLLTLFSLLALALAANVETAYMCFEIMTLVSMPLVLQDALAESRAAALQYLGFSALGASLALLGFFLLMPYAKSTVFVPGGVMFSAGEEQRLIAAFFLMALGFGAKAGLMPLQVWLPVAHPVAPAPASAVLSGVVTKGGVVAVIRVTLYLFGAELVQGTWAQKLLLTLAVLTVFTGSMLAYKEKLLKRRLAYSTVSNVSYVLFGVFLLQPAALTGALLQVVFHAFAKCALFLGAGALMHSLHESTADGFFGCGKRMPLTLAAFAMASLSLVGIPPFGGFIAKWYLAIGALKETGGFGVVGVATLLVSALLTAFYLFPIVTKGYFPGKEFEAGEKTEVGRNMLLAVFVFAAVTLLLGAFPAGLIRSFAALAESLL